jgi:diacylglycerol kinase family enzyme
MGDLRFTVCALGKIIKGFGYNVKLSYPTHDEDEKTGVLPPFVDGKFSIPDDWSVFEGKTQVFMACNVAQVAKDMKPAPSATVDDGYIHLLMAHNLSRFDLLSFLISLESGSHVNDPRLLIHRTKKFVIEPLDENSTMDVDGERYGKASMACSIQPGLANIMAPQLHRHEDQL